MTIQERFFNKFTSRVFVSHNKKDRDVARQIAVFLAAEGIKTWFDEWKISAGDSIIDEIEVGLNKCTHFLIVWSKNSSSSNWVREELKSILIESIEKKTIKVIPIVLDDTEKPPLLKDKKHIRYHGGNEKDRDEIIESIVGTKPKTSFAQAVVKMYHDIVFDRISNDPFGIKYCPNCGSNDLTGNSTIDHERDDIYYSIKCKSCGWSDWTEG